MVSTLLRRLSPPNEDFKRRSIVLARRIVGRVVLAAFEAFTAVLGQSCSVVWEGCVWGG